MSSKQIGLGHSELHASADILTLHQKYFPPFSKVVHLFIVGTGNVGSALVGQVLAQQESLFNTNRVDIRIAGLANSRRMVFGEVGLNASNWRAKLESASKPMDTEFFLNRMFSLNLPNSIFIDNTASKGISKLYQRILSRGIAVVTCNKIAASASYSTYLALKRTAVENRTHFRFETNVGAGLPVIQTISNMVRTGDRIHRIEAVLSGSLNFIFNSFCNGLRFSEAVLLAKEKGYTEPDPLIDLKGIDVARKLVILAREAGFQVEGDDVVFEGYLPAPLPDSYNPELFPSQMLNYDDHFERVRKVIAAHRARLRVVASFEGGNACIALREVQPEHPFYNLEGSDNILMILSDRYPVQPLTIKGAGAGAEVTASGVFADVLSIINN
jgi:aspartokinase/homoserine dehydrogenase 1